MDKKILGFVKKVRGRQREQAVIDSIMTSVISGLVIAVLISLLSLRIPMYYAIPVSVGMVLLSFAGGIVIGIIRTPSLESSALMADSKGYKEKITTALELAGRNDAFSILQKRDALKVVQVFKVRKEFPLHISWKKCVMLVLLTIVFGVTGTVDTPARRLAVTRHEVNDEADLEIAKIEKLQREIEKADKLTDVEKAELEEQFEQAKQDMKKADTVEDLKKAEDRITKKMEMDAEELKDSYTKELLADAVKQNKADQAKRVEDAIKDAEIAMDKASLEDEKSKRDAYSKLEKLAETTGDEDLKKAANEYKNSDYSNSDYLSANQALKNVKNNIEASDIASNEKGNGTQENPAQDGQNGQQGSQNGQGGQQESQGRNDGQENNGQSSQGQNGQQGNSGQGSQGQNGQQGNSGQGSQGQNGQQENSGQENQGMNGSGSGNSGGPGWNRGSKDGAEGEAKVNENVTIPEGISGNDDDLSGKANGNDTTTRQKSSQANTWSGNKVSYGQVSQQYKEKAYKKVNGSSYPGKMKEKIRNYFDGLE